jgi:drug/metabolite transporter (DMT)-like permease
MLSEVVFATVSSVWVGGERFGGQVALGAALVLSAAVLSTLEERGSG